jgi:hypothetical protein
MFPTGINATGTVVGWFTTDANAPYSQVTPDAPASGAFFRSADGVITTFSAPGTLMPSSLGINASGTILGNYTLPASPTDSHGFVRPGSRTKVSVPLVLPQNRHPERSASPIYRVIQRLWRGVEGPRRYLVYPCCSELFDHRSPTTIRGSAVDGPAVSFPVLTQPLQGVCRCLALKSKDHVSHRCERIVTSPLMRQCKQVQGEGILVRFRNESVVEALLRVPSLFFACAVRERRWSLSRATIRPSLRMSPSSVCARPVRDKVSLRD